jgi:hypothetical protein
MKQKEVELQKMMELEDELQGLKKEYGYKEKPALWVRIGDWFVERMGSPRPVSRKKYLILALTMGWFCGAHRFYAGHKITAVLYLAFCWTGIPMALTILDILLMLLNTVPDENGMDCL